MEASRVWKNLLSGKQAVPTVACPSCGAQVPEFRIHSHLDTCLTTLPSVVPEEEAAVVEGVHELSDGEQNRNRKGRAGGARGQGRGRGRGRKRREGAEKKGRVGDTDGRKRARNDTGGGEYVEGEKGLGAPLLSDDDDDANFYQHREYSVSGLDEIAKSRKETPLSDLQKQELLASGVLTVERHEVSAMVLELDRLLADFQATEGTADGSSMSFLGRMSRFRNGNMSQNPALNQVGVPGQVSRSSARTTTADAEGHDGTQSEQGKALEALWEQWATAEWPDGPLPSGFHAGLPERLESKSRAAQDVHTDAEKVGMGKCAGQEHHAAPIKPMSTLNYSESGGGVGEKSEAMPHLVVRCTELLTKSERREATEVGMKPGLKISNDGKTSSSVMTGKLAHGLPPRGEQYIPTKLSSHSVLNVEHSSVAESSDRKAGPPSPSTAPASNPADTNGSSRGLTFFDSRIVMTELQACPICNISFAPNTSNRETEKHIDECLNDMAGLLD